MKALNVYLSTLFFVSSICAVEIPSVQFTSVPPRGTIGTVYCQVKNVDRTQYGVAFFLNLYGVWYTKPLNITPVTGIDSSNYASFPLVAVPEAKADVYAEKLAALVVPLAYSGSIPLMGGQSPIPAEIYSNAIAYTILDLSTTNDYLNFSGMAWKKKDTGTVVWGPGPNYFSGNNVFVDTNGNLHLKITYDNGQWRCAEINTTNTLGYGTYRFYVGTNTSLLPANAVLGLFTYGANDGYAHREIDVEYSRGTVVGNGTSNFWQFVIQPWNWGGHRVQFTAPTNMNESVHEFMWAPNGVWFNSYTNRTGYSKTYGIFGTHNLPFNSLDRNQTTGQFNFSGPTNITLRFNEAATWPKDHFFLRAELEDFIALPGLINSYWFTPMNGIAIPKTGDELTHINLWLSDTSGLVVGNNYETVISRFEFIPLDSSSGPILKLESIDPKDFRMTVTCPGN